MRTDWTSTWRCRSLRWSTLLQGRALCGAVAALVWFGEGMPPTICCTLKLDLLPNSISSPSQCHWLGWGQGKEYKSTTGSQTESGRHEGVQAAQNAFDFFSVVWKLIQRWTTAVGHGWGHAVYSSPQSVSKHDEQSPKLPGLWRCLASLMRITSIKAGYLKRLSRHKEIPKSLIKIRGSKWADEMKGETAQQINT